MAPSTRLRAHPERRVAYAPSGAIGSRGNPILLEQSPEPEVARPQSITPEPEVPAKKPARKIRAGLRVKASGITKTKAVVKKITRASAPKKKERPLRQECSICCTEKAVRSSFKVPEDADTCAHFQTICGTCIQKMLRTKVTERNLTEAELVCPFPKCDHVLDYAALKQAVSKATLADYDKAVLNHALAVGETYIACLNHKCSHYFSTEDCKGDSKGRKFKILCPYCDYEMCMRCNRPWKSHRSGDCNKAKEKEDKKSEDAIKRMGAKPCPQCGVIIQKSTGCDHMSCQKCRHNFCWQCLVPYTSNVQHLDTCIHGRRNVAEEAGNFVPDELTDAQIIEMFHQNELGMGALPPFPPPFPPAPPMPGLPGMPPDMPDLLAGQGMPQQAFNAIMDAVFGGGFPFGGGNGH